MRALKIFFVAINQEAASEGTFSFSGQVFSKLRTQLEPERVCRTVTNAAGDKRKATEPAAIQEAYKRLRSRRASDRRQAAGAAASAAAAAADAQTAAIAEAAAAVVS